MFEDGGRGWKGDGNDVGGNGDLPFEAGGYMLGVFVAGGAGDVVDDFFGVSFGFFACVWLGGLVGSEGQRGCGIVGWWSTYSGC